MNKYPRHLSAEALILVFDWGNTLMLVDPGEKGPMFEWKHVEAVIGAEPTLKTLAERYRIVLATNANESNAVQVHAALSRVHLAEYIDQIYTYLELGSRKPEPDFFHTIEKLQRASPMNLVMIGDDLQADISGAKACGWKAAWYNPACLPATNLYPEHDFEVNLLADLPEILAQEAPPDLKMCKNLFLRYNLPSNLKAHVTMVAGVAYILAVWLRQVGVKVNPILTHRGGLLHDLARSMAFQIQENGGGYIDHGELAAQILYSLELPEIAKIALTHPLDTIFSQSRYPTTWEQKLVYFSDKLVEGSTLVSIQERLISLSRRYPELNSRLVEYQDALHDMQAEICRKIGLTTEDFYEKIRCFANQPLIKNGQN